MRSFVINNEMINSIVETILLNTNKGWYSIREINLTRIFDICGYKVKTGVLRKYIIPFMIKEGLLITKNTSLGTAYKSNTLKVNYDVIPEKFLSFIKQSKEEETIKKDVYIDTPIDLGDVAYILDSNSIIKITIRYIEKELIGNTITNDSDIKIKYKGVDKNNKEYIICKQDVYKDVNELVEHLINNIK